MDNTPIAPAAPAEAKVDPVLADALGLQPESKSKEPVASPAEDKQQKSEGKDNSKESKKDKEESKTDDKKTDDAKKEEGEAKGKIVDGQPTEFEVAGKKYSKFEEAVDAVKKIAGDNTRITGDNKSLTKRTFELEGEVNKLADLTKQLQEANQAWKQYYEDGGEKPDTSVVDIESKISAALEKHEKGKAELSRKEQYQAELDEIFQDAEINTVLPIFKEMIEEYGDSPKVSPKKLYERAKKLAKSENLKDLESIDKQVDERVLKELAKKEAGKINGSAGGGSAKSKEEKIDPVLADALKDAGIM
jgi:hypothetical protein